MLQNSLNVIYILWNDIGLKILLPKAILLLWPRLL